MHKLLGLHAHLGRALQQLVGHDVGCMVGQCATCNLCNDGLQTNAGNVTLLLFVFLGWHGDDLVAKCLHKLLRTSL